MIEGIRVLLSVDSDSDSFRSSSVMPEPCLDSTSMNKRRYMLLSYSKFHLISQHLAVAGSS